MFLLSPHPDDETLFASYRIMRDKPVVIILTHPTAQGDNAKERLFEAYSACQILGVPVMFLGIPEDKFSEELLREKLTQLNLTGTVIAPALDGGHPHHDITYKVATDMYSDVKYYKTYGKGETRAEGWEVEATVDEMKLKRQAMNCYQTQINNPLTAHYFITLNEYE
jgi:LmbE family N-acetylglucosaminyl deacetylase